MVKVAINGFGRIGALFTRAYLENRREKFKLIAVNASGTSGNMTPEEVAHRLKYDSNYGVFGEEIAVFPDSIVYFPRAEGVENVGDGERIKILGEPDAAKLPWKDLGVDIVIDCTGELLTAEKAEKHLKAGAKTVILSAPPKDENIPMFVYGVNHYDYLPEMKVISNASCTTNALAPLIRIIGWHWNISKIFFTTVHAFTGDQRLTDGKHKDPRRARRASGNIIPTKTGAAENIVKIFPFLKEKVGGLAYRVDTPTGSALDVNLDLKPFTAKSENWPVDKNAMEKVLKEGDLIFRIWGVNDSKEFYGLTEEELVSSDFAKDTRACVVDLPLLKVLGGDSVKIVAWYDNEWGYVSQLGRLLNYVIEKNK